MTNPQQLDPQTVPPYPVVRMNIDRRPLLPSAASGALTLDSPGARHHRPKGDAEGPQETTRAARDGRGAALVGYSFVATDLGQWAWPWPPASSVSSGWSTTRVSVVSSSEAIEAALASAERVTLTGSMTPWSIRLPYSPVLAL